MTGRDEDREWEREQNLMYRQPWRFREAALKTPRVPKSVHWKAPHEPKEEQ